MELVKPRRLNPGDSLRIVAPASNMVSLPEATVEIGVNNLEKLGFNVEISPDVYRSYKGTAGTPRERAVSLMDAFIDDSVDGVMCVWGGYNSNDILAHLDYNVFRENPKVFSGFSDITILNTVLYTNAGLVNLNGPAFITFTRYFLMPWEVEIFKQVTMEGDTPLVLQASPTMIDDPQFYLHPEILVEEKHNPGWSIVKDGKAEGRLIGGHLGTLLCLAGTEYWPSLEGHILFIEADEEDGSPANVARQLRHLQHLGAFDEVSGLLVGRIPEMLGLKDDRSIESLLKDVLVGLDIPVVTGMDFGHTNPIMTIPVGIMAEIDTQKRTLTYLEPYVQG
ncbi:MAG: LD-carboxypeptidase [Candidatus Bathyarchaeota archaeon]|nr:LD-carboxypeptidase [Candidatus Bathyarchaeota archaeon]